MNQSTVTLSHEQCIAICNVIRNRGARELTPDRYLSALYEGQESIQARLYDVLSFIAPDVLALGYQDIEGD